MERELSMVNKAYIRMNVKHDDLDEKVDAIQNKVRDKKWLCHKKVSATFEIYIWHTEGNHLLIFTGCKSWPIYK